MSPDILAEQKRRIAAGEDDLKRLRSVVSLHVLKELLKDDQLDLFLYGKLKIDLVRCLLCFTAMRTLSCARRHINAVHAKRDFYSDGGDVFVTHADAPDNAMLSCVCGADGPASGSHHFHCAQCAQIVAGFAMPAHFEAEHPSVALSYVSRDLRPPRMVQPPSRVGPKRPRPAPVEPRPPPPQSPSFIIVKVQGDDEFLAFARQTKRGLHHPLHCGHWEGGYHCEGAECRGRTDGWCGHVADVLAAPIAARSSTACALKDKAVLQRNLQLLFLDSFEQLRAAVPALEQPQLDELRAYLTRHGVTDMGAAAAGVALYSDHDDDEVWFFSLRLFEERGGWQRTRVTVYRHDGLVKCSACRQREKRGVHSCAHKTLALLARDDVLKVMPQPKATPAEEAALRRLVATTKALAPLDWRRLLVDEGFTRTFLPLDVNVNACHVCGATAVPVEGGGRYVAHFLRRRVIEERQLCEMRCVGCGLALVCAADGCRPAALAQLHAVRVLQRQQQDLLVNAHDDGLPLPPQTGRQRNGALQVRRPPQDPLPPAPALPRGRLRVGCPHERRDPRRSQRLVSGPPEGPGV
jgi:hypothetical protein